MRAQPSPIPIPGGEGGTLSPYHRCLEILTGGHFVEQSGMSNGIKGLTEVQCDDHYIRVAREQFRN